MSSQTPMAPWNTTSDKAPFRASRYLSPAEAAAELTAGAQLDLRRAMRRPGYFPVIQKHYDGSVTVR